MHSAGQGISGFHRRRLRLERRVRVQAQLAQCGFSCAVAPPGQASGVGAAQKQGPVTAAPRFSGPRARFGTRLLRFRTPLAPSAAPAA